MIPISTDAPIYHPPIATVSLIVINVLCFLAFCRSPVEDFHAEVQFRTDDGEVLNEQQLELALEEFETEEEQVEFLDSLEPVTSATSGGWQRVLSVEFGKIRPWQWVTNNFMHLNWVHLIGNMIFLWAFGLIVEGKVGSLVFLAIYMGIGTLYGFVLQMGTLVVGLDQGMALGASAAIFGLLAFCVAWAPANEFEIFWGSFMRMGTFEISVLSYGAIFLFKELFFWAMNHFQMSSELLHLLGFLVAMPVALWMVKAGRVDCEGWDIFSYLNGTTGSDSSIHRANKRRASQGKGGTKGAGKGSSGAERKRIASQLQEQVTQAITSGEYDLAIRLQEKITSSNPNSSWRQNDLYLTIQGLLKEKRFSDAVPLLEQHIEKFDLQRFTLQKLLIKIWLQEQRPQQAIKYIRGINAAFLEPEEKKQLRELAVHARKLIEAGVVD